MSVDENTAQWKYEYKGKIYFFCAPGCLYQFKKNPEKYLVSEHTHEHENHSHQHHKCC